MRPEDLKNLIDTLRKFGMSDVNAMMNSVDNTIDKMCEGAFRKGFDEGVKASRVTLLELLSGHDDLHTQAFAETFQIKAGSNDPEHNELVEELSAMVGEAARKHTMNMFKTMLASANIELCMSEEEMKFKMSMNQGG